MGMTTRERSNAGQMTVEMSVALPVLIVIALIAVNAMTFFSECASFDRVACEAVRVYAASPAYGQKIDRSISLVKAAIDSHFDESNLDVSVSHGMVEGDFDEYIATLTFHPTLFGRGLRSQVFGVDLPSLKHEVRYVVDGYKPGVVA